MSRLLRFLLTSLMVFSVALPAAHADGAEVTKRGTGTLGSHWELQLDREYRVEVDFEVNSIAARAGHVWKIVMRHNGVVFFNGERIANGLGDYQVERNVKNVSGPDTIKVRAVDQRNGEVIQATASI